MAGKIVITTWPLETKLEDVKICVKKSKPLSAAIDKYYNETLKPKDIELFNKMDNVIVTENGYYGAFYKKDIELAKEDKDGSRNDK